MDQIEDQSRGLEALVVRRVGELRHTDDVWRPYQLIDPGGIVVDAVEVYFADLLAAEKGRVPGAV